jgi:hypothetical protein
MPSASCASRADPTRRGRWRKAEVWREVEHLVGAAVAGAGVAQGRTVHSIISGHSDMCRCDVCFTHNSGHSRGESGMSALCQAIAALTGLEWQSFGSPEPPTAGLPRMSRGRSP